MRDQKLGPFKVIDRVDMSLYQVFLPDGCRSHPVSHCDLLLHSTTYSSLRSQQTEIKDHMKEYEINCIYDVRIDIWSRKRGPYLQLLTYFVNFDSPEWIKNQE